MDQHMLSIQQGVLKATSWAKTSGTYVNGYPQYWLRDADEAQDEKLILPGHRCPCHLIVFHADGR